MICLFRKKQGGFTLLEIILTIVIAAILGAMMFQYFGTSFTQSSVPIFRLEEAFDLKQVMENITADYESTGKATTDLDTLKTNIGAEGTDQNSGYGQYHVVDNHFIEFVSQVEAPDPDDPPDVDTLKVTIQNDLGEILTVLFVSE